MGLPRTNAQPTVGPIDIVQAQGDDFMGTQAKPCEEQEHGAVAQVAGGAVFVCRQQLLDFLGRQASRECGMRPLRWGEGCGLSTRADLTAEDEKPQERADHHRGPLPATPLAFGSFLADKRGDHRCC